MTVEEAIHAAVQGDISAMKALGAYYFEQKNMSECKTWYYRAALAGDLESAKLGELLYLNSANASEQYELWEEAGTDLLKYMDCLEFQIKAPETTVDECKALYKKMNHALYRMGCGALHLKNVSIAIEFLKSAAKDEEFMPGDPEAKALLERLMN